MKISPVFALSLLLTLAATAGEPLTPAARRQLESQALAGSADAALELALDADEFSKTSADRATAAKWYQLAADRQIGVAHLRLGKLHETGDGVPQDFAEARTHYEQAAAAGQPAAYLQLGILFLEGWGVPADRARAVTEIERAATAGYHPAQLILSEMYASGVGPKADMAKALQWAKTAAAAKDAEGQHLLGRYAHSRGVNLMQDMRLAREWYQLSAEQDYGNSMIGMAATYLRPGATEAEVNLARQWLELASDGGNKDATFILAALYGCQSAQNPAHEAKARELLKLASDRKSSAADELLDIIAKGKSVPEAFAYVLATPYTTRYVERYFGRHSSTALTRPPQPVKIARALYPSALRMQNIEGQAVIEFVVDSTGRVRNAKVVSATHPAFGECALQSVSEWRFDPALKNGRRVNTARVQVPVAFEISLAASPIDKVEGTVQP